LSTQTNIDNPTFTFPVRVYYEDTDAGGVVYHACYLNFMERARTEWLRDKGFEQDRLREQEGLLFPVRSMKIEYLLPARFNDLLQVSCEPRHRGNASLRFYQTITRGDDALCTAEVRIACIDAKAFVPKAIPQRLHDAL